MTPQDAELFDNIAQEVERITKREIANTFVYVEAVRGMQAVSIFVDEGNRVVYHDPDGPVFEAIEDLWESQNIEESKRWNSMLLDFKGNSFDAQFSIIDRDVPGEDDADRRERVLAERFGEKEVVYPSWDGYVELTLDDLKHLDDEQ